MSHHLLNAKIGESKVNLRKDTLKMQNKILKLLLGVLILSLAISCSSIKTIIPKEKKPFQARNFDSANWKIGDEQTRGEMSQDLRWRENNSDPEKLRHKNQSEVLEILGQPDRKTRGRCCGGRDTNDSEVWLYNVEIKRKDSA